jgi:hypothetical protein
MVVAGAQGQAIAEPGTRGPPTEGPLADVDRALRGRAPAPTAEASSHGQEEPGGRRPQTLHFGAALTKVCARGYG